MARPTYEVSDYIYCRTVGELREALELYTDDTRITETYVSCWTDKDTNEQSIIIE